MNLQFTKRSNNEKWQEGFSSKRQDKQQQQQRKRMEGRERERVAP